MKFTEIIKKDNFLKLRCYKNGKKHWEKIFSNGALNGISKGWDENGKKNYQVNYKDGVRNGLHTVWETDGTIKRSLYDNGNKIKIKSCIVSTSIKIGRF